MPLGKRQRKVLLVLGLALGGLLLLCVSLPLWFPWLLRPLSHQLGAHFSRYERVGYGRFVVRDLTFTNQNIRLNVKEVEAFVPSVWLWKLRSTHGGRPFAKVNGWELRSESMSTNTGSPSIFRIVEDITGVLSEVQKWVPSATVTNGSLQIEKV